jgi:hypothetical protein
MGHAVVGNASILGNVTATECKDLRGGGEHGSGWTDIVDKEGVLGVLYYFKRIGSEYFILFFN